jgi:hypothetical protein
MSELLPALSRPEAWFFFHVNELPDDGWDNATESNVDGMVTVTVPVTGPEGSTTLDFKLEPPSRRFGTAGAPSKLVTPTQFREHADRLEVKARKSVIDLATDDLADAADEAELGADCLREYSNFYDDLPSKQSDLHFRELALRRRCVTFLVELERRNTAARWKTKTLTSRSLGEIHLAMDWLNWPANRDHRLVDLNDQLVAEYGVRMDGQVHILRFASPANPLSEELDGGTGEFSTLISPGMFWHLGDRLAAVPDVKTKPVMTGLLTAARCFSEVVRFIPEGEDALPRNMTSDLERAFQRLQPGALTRAAATERANICIQRLQELMK